MHDMHEATEILLQTAREYSSSNATDGDVVAAAYHLVATKVREHGYQDLAKSLDRAAEQAETAATSSLPAPQTIAAKGLKVCVERRSNDFHACLEDQRGIWGCGPSANAAIGDLVRSHTEAFGLKITEGGA